MESPKRVNILLRTFPGLSLPQTVCIPLPASTTTTSVLEQIATTLPPSLSARVILTTTSNRTILPSSSPISSLLPPAHYGPTSTQNKHASLFLPLRLSAALPGGKGGFGSQLRAAGGRMSSRKRKNALASDPNAGVGSNRNLDGRRLRTITEAKNLAEYLAIKPEMEKREKEERRRRWESVVEAAEKREEEIRRGLGGGGRGKGLSEEWLMEKEDAGERTKDAVRRVMMGGAGGWRDSVAGKGSGGSSAGASASGSGASREPSEEESDQDEDMDLDEDEIKVLEKEAAEGDVDAIWVLKNHVKRPPVNQKKEERRFIGFDEDDEFMSGSEDEDAPTAKLKGKETVSAGSD